MARDRKNGRMLVAAAGIVAFLTLAAVAFVVWWSSSAEGRWQRYLDIASDDTPPAALDAATESRIAAFCGDCHTMPRPESFARDTWHDEVLKGYEFYARSGRNDLDPPPPWLAAAYFRSRAPERMRFPVPEEAEGELGVDFSVESLSLGREGRVVPSTSYLRWARLEPDAAPVLLVCDMRYGGLMSVDLRDPRRPTRLLARLNNPCHVEPCDLDGNGATDLLVADLGSRRAGDHERGRVIWLRPGRGESGFETVVLASGLGRVADLRPGDFDDDGDLDLMVAVFGAWDTGGIVLLRNVAPAGEQPRFEPETIDPRPGTIHVPLHDLNGDDLPDFVALVSQEYEQIEAFVNQGDGRFGRQLLWAAPDLTFGSSGVELVDLDRDGDLDILYTNGDTFDNNNVNGWHGVQWLENLGGLQFAYHRLTDMLGAYRALAGDVDLDGDLDVVAVAWLPPVVSPPGVRLASLASVVCLEQTEPGVFVRHTLQKGPPQYATLELADFDDDGDLDFAAGRHVFADRVAGSQEVMEELVVWWNGR